MIQTLSYRLGSKQEVFTGSDLLAVTDASPDLRCSAIQFLS